jgi:hypothetical protein
MRAPEGWECDHVAPGDSAAVFALGHGDIGKVDGGAAPRRGGVDGAVVVLETAQMGRLSMWLHDCGGPSREYSSREGTGDHGADTLA